MSSKGTVYQNQIEAGIIVSARPEIFDSGEIKSIGSIYHSLAILFHSILSNFFQCDSLK